MGSGAFLGKSGAALGQTGAQANCGLPGGVCEAPEKAPAPSELLEPFPDLIAKHHPQEALNCIPRGLAFCRNYLKHSLSVKSELCNVQLRVFIFILFFFIKKRTSLPTASLYETLTGSVGNLGAGAHCKLSPAGLAGVSYVK